jgi:hypothetical protein
MKKFTILMLVGATVVPTAAVAHETDAAYATRGACEAASAEMSNSDRYWLADTFPNVFSSDGEVMSFLARAWTCDRNDGQYYITDHRAEVLGSEWFQRRNH